jgi:hypothetical protein
MCLPRRVGEVRIAGVARGGVAHHVGVSRVLSATTCMSPGPKMLHPILPPKEQWGMLRGGEIRGFQGRGSTITASDKIIYV